MGSAELFFITTFAPESRTSSKILPARPLLNKDMETVFSIALLIDFIPTPYFSFQLPNPKRTEKNATALEPIAIYVQSSFFSKMVRTNDAIRSPNAITARTTEIMKFFFIKSPLIFIDKFII